MSHLLLISVALLVPTELDNSWKLDVKSAKQ